MIKLLSRREAGVDVRIIGQAAKPPDQDVPCDG